MHQIFWCYAGVLAQDSTTQVLSISSYRLFVLLPAAHLVDLPVHTGLQPTHFSTGFSWNTMKCCYHFPNLSSSGAGDYWLTQNVRKGLSCIQSREKIGAREEMFIILVSTQRSSIYFVNDLWSCQPLQTHGRACLRPDIQDGSISALHQNVQY